MTTKHITSSIQPRTFAQVEHQYSSVSARCVCQDTLKRKRDANGREIGLIWVHANGDVWCRPVGN